MSQFPPAPPTPPSSGQPGMHGQQAKAITCSNCGAPLGVSNPLAIKTIVCKYCGSQLDLKDPRYRVLAQLPVQNAPPPRTQFELGMQATLVGEHYAIIGRIRYEDRQDGETYYWDEWLLMTPEGHYSWLTDDSRGFKVYRPFTPTHPVDPRSHPDTIAPEGQNAEVKEWGNATITYFAGELNWTPKLNSQVGYLEAHLGGLQYSLEFTESEIEYYKGGPISIPQLEQAFGVALPPRLQEPTEQIATTAVENATPSKARGSLPGWVIPVGVALIILVCVAIFIILPSSGSSSSGGSRSTGCCVSSGGGSSSSSSGGHSSGSSGHSSSGSGSSSHGGGK